jgi:hypothetical protein
VSKPTRKGFFATGRAAGTTSFGFASPVTIAVAAATGIGSSAYAGTEVGGAGAVTDTYSTGSTGDEVNEEAVAEEGLHVAATARGCALKVGAEAGGSTGPVSSTVTKLPTGTTPLP